MKATLGEELKKLIPEGTAQKTIAMEWLNAWRSGHPGEKTPDTAETRLSDCLANRVSGVKFFFSDPARRAVTFEVFQVPPAARGRLERLASELLEQEPNPQIVLDATTGPQAGDKLDQMFQAIKETFFATNAVWPMVLLVTEQQYERLPRSYDDFKPKLVTKRVAKEAARAELRELVEQGALAAAPYPVLPYERWLAIQLGAAVVCDPPDGLSLFASKGALPALPEVTMPLARIADAPPAPVALRTKDPFELRALMLDLATGTAEVLGTNRDYYREQYRRMDQARRLSWAAQLRITASASREEWIEGLPKRIAPVTVATSGKHLEHARWLARRTSTPAVLAFDGRVIAINPPEHVLPEIESLGKVEVEAIPHEGFPALENMLAEAGAMTADYLLDDPFLADLVDRHATDATSADRLALEAARNALFFSTEARPAPAKEVEDWRGALLALVDGTEPMAGLRVRIQGNENDKEAASAFVVQGKPDATPPWPGRPLAEVHIERGSALVVVVPSSQHTYSSVKVRRGEPRLVPQLSGIPSTWVGQITSALAVRGDALTTSLTEGSDWVVAAFEVPQDRWELADRLLAFLLGALRVAAATADPLLLPAGRLMLPLSNNIFAEIHIRAHAATASRRPVGSLVQPITRERQGSWELLSLTTPLSTHRAVSPWGDVNIVADVPHGVHLAGHGYRADIVFRSSPLFVGTTPASHTTAVASTAVTAAVVAAAAAARAKKATDRRLPKNLAHRERLM